MLSQILLDNLIYSCTSYNTLLILVCVLFFLNDKMSFCCVIQVQKCWYYASKINISIVQLIKFKVVYQITKSNDTNKVRNIDQRGVMYTALSI